jgi:hypothetical protein
MGLQVIASRNPQYFLEVVVRYDRVQLDATAWVNYIGQ